MSATPNRNLPLDALRSALTLLVVLHHALLAYSPYAPPPPASLGLPLWWAAFPIVDSVKWKGSELLTTWNDSFLMALFFLLSGVFVPASLRRKGAAAFLRDRARRLGLVFVVAAGLLAPLAYFAAYVSLAPQPTSFAHQWLGLGSWPAGPAWFLWVLLAFDLVAAGLFVLRPSTLEALGRAAARLGDRPLRAWCVVAGGGLAAYVTMASVFDPLGWSSFGPFFVQTARVGLYLVFFAAGVALGASGSDRGLLAAEGALARRWRRFTLAALVVFVVALASWIVIFAAAARGPVGFGLRTVGNVMFPLTCAASSFAVLALALRFLRRPGRLLLALTPSAFGIYVLHYVFVTWLQLALLPASLPAPAKAILVFLGAVLGAWAVTVAVRRVRRALAGRARGAGSSGAPATSGALSPAGGDLSP